MSPSSETKTQAATLSRGLGVSHAIAIVVGTIIGSGIFLVPTEMMQAVGSAGLVYLAWIVGGLLSFAGALTYAELGAMKPQAGGEYVYIRDAYGPLPGFLYAWTWFAIAKPASIATLATGFVLILRTFPDIWIPQPGCYSITLRDYLRTVAGNCRGRAYHRFELHRHQAEPEIFRWCSHC